MGALIIDDSVRLALTGLAEHAMDNRYSLDDLMDIKNDPAKSPGFDPKFNCVVPIGYRVVFTVEEHPKTKQEGSGVPETVALRHMSMSTNKEGMLPPPYFIQEVMEILGFDSNILLNSGECMVHTKEEGAINILEAIE